VGQVCGQQRCSKSPPGLPILGTIAGKLAPDLRPTSRPELVGLFFLEEGRAEGIHKGHGQGGQVVLRR